MIRYLLRTLGDQAGRISEGSLEEVTCVLTMGGIGRVTGREKQLSAGGGMKGRTSGPWGAVGAGSHSSLGFITR